MLSLTESNVLLRVQADLPMGFKVATAEFHNGWDVMRSGGVVRLEKKVRARGWNLIGIPATMLRSGVGETSQQAIANALNQALQGVDSQANAAEVKQVELTQYPWFCLARVRVHSYRIQEGAELPALDEPVPPIGTRFRRSSRPSELSAELAGVMPMLKGMLAVSGVSEMTAQ
jgi:hypothetical protein